MAEVANMPQASASELSSVSVTAISADIPKESHKNEVSDLSSGSQLGTSPNQEKSSNSHYHDSEYDTASDLEGGAQDDYDDEDGEEEEDEDSNEDVGNTDTDSVEYDIERQRGDGQEQIEGLKKVDEDRSNPQYIPKKGTFYEHDDRTADEPEGKLLPAVEPNEAGENVSASPTTISQASKTLKKWQPASGVDRWSHDRFDANEQAPKSRAELVSAYGYDIRNEDGPPRARRRRRYARGPNKYSRNWEDETAYIKASNTQRKPPRPEDFPALEERQKARKSRSFRDEKENRFDRQTDRTRNLAQHPSNRENKDHRKSAGNVKNYKNNTKQTTMEFKNKNRTAVNTSSINSNLNRGTKTIEKDINFNKQVCPSVDVNEETQNFAKPSANNKALNIQNASKINNLSYNGYEPRQSSELAANMLNNSNTSGYNGRDVTAAEKFSSGHISNRHPVNTPNTSNLSARLQQAQNRNDPSHVGSIQMHTLANQHSAQVTNQNIVQNTVIDHQQQHQNTQQVNHQEQGRTKRYSSLRQRAQHDTGSNVPSTQHMDQHTLQQLHIQQEVQQIPANVHTSQQLMLQDQHLLQANLMQLYHQENLQAQMQALQVSGLPTVSAAQQNTVGKQPYSTIHEQYSSGAVAPAAPAYYTPTTPDYNSAAAAPGPSQGQFPQQATAFIQTSSPAAPLAFATAPQQPLNQNSMGSPITVSATAQVPSGSVNYVQTTPQNPSAATAAGYPNFANYQNFNTVGGTTYFVPSPQPATRSVVLQQRRPTNAIPILPPSEKTKRSQENKEDSKVNTIPAGTPAESPISSANAPIGSAENIDHILDNMFVQRAPYQPQARKSASPPSDDVNKTTPAGGPPATGETGKALSQSTSVNATLQDNESSSKKTSDEKCQSSATTIKADSASIPGESALLDENIGKKTVQQ